MTSLPCEPRSPPPRGRVAADEAAGRWGLAATRLPSGRDQRLPRGGRADRRSHAAGGQAHTRSTEGSDRERARPYPRPSRPSGRIGRGLRQAAHSVLGGCGRRRAGGASPGDRREPESASPEPARDALLGRPGPQRRPRAPRRRRRGGFSRDRRAGPFARARGLLARGGPGADHRRRAQLHQCGHRRARPQRAQALPSRPIRPRTAARHASWRSSSRSSCASATARRCATRAASPSSSRACPLDQRGPGRPAAGHPRNCALAFSTFPNMRSLTARSSSNCQRWATTASTSSPLSGARTR